MKRRHEPTQEQKERAAARREAFRALTAKIDAMTDEERAAFSERMPAIATVDGRALSGKNSMLVAHQIDAPTIVGGFKQWKQAGRAVKKGESGLCIWIPRTGEDSADPDGFFMGYVFDISQTEPMGDGVTEEPSQAEPEPQPKQPAESPTPDPFKAAQNHILSRLQSIVEG